MMKARTVTGWLLIGLLGGALAQGCGSSVSPRRPPGTGAAAGSSGKDAGSMTVEPLGNSGNGGESPFDPACGISEASYCVPDFETNSLCLAAPGGKGGSGGSGGGSSAGSGRGGTGGATSVGGSGAVSAAGAGGEGGTPGGGEAGASQGGVGAAAGDQSSTAAEAGQGGERSGAAGQMSIGGAGETATGGTLAIAGRSGSAGTLATGGAMSAPAAVSCQVVENPKHKGTALATCRPAGTGTEGAPCFSGADCAPKFACVGDGPGQCRAYCCSGPEQCQAYTGTHCAPELLVPEKKGGRQLPVPVCTPAVKCSLAEKYPCPDGVTCSCPNDSACVVVSDDGTTSCVPVSQLPPEGSGDDVNKSCPCAWGFVCSQATNRCVKLCEVAAAACDSGRCQASPSLPAGWGTCVGVAPIDGGAP